MRKSLVSLVALMAISAAAHATPKTPTTPPGHAYGHGAPTANQNTHVGITNINAALSGSRSDASAAARSNSRSASNATGGVATAGGGAGGAGGTSASSSALQLAGAQLGGGYLDLSGARLGGGDTYVPRQTPPSYAPEARTPIKSCRLTMGGGGADDKVSLSLGIPIGNDAICLHAVKEAAMLAANKRAAEANRKAPFSEEDFLRNDCTIEGMSDTRACRELGRTQQASAQTTRVVEAP
jgi:hypothetical protein